MGTARRRKSTLQLDAQPKRNRNAIRKSAGATEIHVRTNLPQGKRISNALHVLVRSEVPAGAPLAVYQTAISHIAAAWNICSLPAAQQSNAVRELVASVPGLDEAKRRDVIKNVERLIAKKQDLFPEDRRTIVSWDVRLQENRLHISAAAMSAAA
jgi:hypothetical protein